MKKSIARPRRERNVTYASASAQSSTSGPIRIPSASSSTTVGRTSRPWSRERMAASADAPRTTTSQLRFGCGHCSRHRGHCAQSSLPRMTRSSSATDHAWKGQPVAACGAAPSAVSETEPSPQSPRWPRSPSRSPSRRDPDAARGVDVRPDQPRPHRALVVGGVALGRVAAVAGAVGRVVRARASAARAASAARRGTRRRRAAASRGPRERPVRERHGEQLVRPHRRRRRRPARRRRRAGRAPSARTKRRENDAPPRSPQATSRARRVRPSRAGDAASASIQSALTSTGLPARGVTGTPSMRASIQVSAQPVGALARAARRQRRRRCRSGCRRRGASTISSSVGASSAARSSSPVTRDVPPERVEEPERAVDRVVLERPGVGGVREHPLGDGRGRAPQHLAALVGAAGREEQALVRGHQVARPLAEPRVAGDRGRAGRRSRSRTGRRRARAARRRRRSRPPRATSARPGARRAAHDRGRPAAARRRTAPRPPSPRARRPASSSARERARRPRGPRRSSSPRAASSRARTPRYHAPPGSPARRRRRGRRPRTRSRRPPCSTVGIAVGEALAVHAAPGAERRQLEPHRAGRAEQPVDDADGATGRASSPARARARRRRPASASAARRRSSSNEASSSCPRGSTRAAGPLVRWRAGRRASPTTSTGSSADEAEHPAPPARRRRPTSSPW